MQLEVEYPIKYCPYCAIEFKSSIYGTHLKAQMSEEHHKYGCELYWGHKHKVGEYRMITYKKGVAELKTIGKCTEVKLYDFLYETETDNITKDNYITSTCLQESRIFAVKYLLNDCKHKYVKVENTPVFKRFVNVLYVITEKLHIDECYVQHSFRYCTERDLSKMYTELALRRGTYNFEFTGYFKSGIQLEYDEISEKDILVINEDVVSNLESLFDIKKQTIEFTSTAAGKRLDWSVKGVRPVIAKTKISKTKKIEKSCINCTKGTAQLQDGNCFGCDDTFSKHVLKTK